MAYREKNKSPDWLTTFRYAKANRRARPTVIFNLRRGRFPAHALRYETTIHVIKGVPTEVKILLIRAGTPWPGPEWGGPRFPERVRDNDYFIHVLPTPGEFI